jgi:hypothetical protein
LVGTNVAGDSLGRVAGGCFKGVWADATGSRFERRVAASRVRRSRNAGIGFLFRVRAGAMLPADQVWRAIKVLTVSYAAAGPEAIECFSPPPNRLKVFLG